MFNKKKKTNDFSSWTLIWALIDTFVNILTLTAVSIILADRIKGLSLFLIILLFIFWAFRPMYLAFKEFIEKFPRKKARNKEPNKRALFIYLICYLFIFIVSIFLFLESVIFLKALVHPLILSFALIAGAGVLIFYHHFTKREFKGPIWSFSKFFFLSTLFLFMSVIFFSSYGLTKGINLEMQSIDFEVYIVNNALSSSGVNSALNYSKAIWEGYNISIVTDSIQYKDVNLSSDEILFLFNNGSNQEECLRYSQIMRKIIENSTKLSMIFLNNLNSGHAGRGCLCNCTFALISPEKLWFFDFTGWNVAHEIGHVLGLSDAPYEVRFRKNLMNDETKRLLFFNSDFIDQSQLDNVVNKSKSLKQEVILNN